MNNPLLSPYAVTALCAYGLLVLCALADGVVGVVARARQKGKLPDAA